VVEDARVTAGGPPDPPLVCPRCRGALAFDAEGATCRSCASRYSRRAGILNLVAGGAGAPGYDPHYFGTLKDVEARHFWFVARARLIRSVLGWCVPDLAQRALFDIGCGSGGLLAYLGATGVPLAGACDAYPESLEIVRHRVQIPLALVDDGPLPPLGPGHSLLGMFDVLEHMDDDVGVLGFLASVLSPGGVLVLTVPAHPFLFDEMDEIAHHRRRYRRSELSRKLVRAGFEIRRITHFMSPLVPPLLLVRGVGRLLSRGDDAHPRRAVEFRVVPVLNGAMRAVLAVERLLLRACSLPFGSSILAVAARPDGTAGNGRDAAL
jgi:SAM-dependent methyltransferase